MGVITAAQARQLLGINPATLRKWVERGHVRKLGRDRYELEDVRDRWVSMACGDDALDCAS